MSRSGYPPCILNWGGQNSFGQRLISLNSKTKRIAFYKFLENFIYFLFCPFLIFFKRRKEKIGKPPKNNYLTGDLIYIFVCIFWKYSKVNIEHKNLRKEGNNCIKKAQALRRSRMLARVACRTFKFE